MSENDVKIWGIHAGQYGEVDKLFLSKTKPCVAIGWPNMGDLNSLSKDRDSFKAKLEKVYPDMKAGAIPTSAGMLYRFAYEIQIGDLIVYPSKHDRQVYIGEIKSEYIYEPNIEKSYPNMRNVQWLKHIPRTNLSQGSLYEIGSALSFFQVKNYADEIQAILKGVTVSPSDDEPDPTIVDVSKGIEDSTRDFIYKKLSKELKGYPFEKFVAHLLNIIGYKTRLSTPGGDGGIDIIAHKDELGIEPPIIKVQIKSVDGNITPDKVQALYGNVEPGEYGLFITLSSFSKQAADFGRSKPNLRLIDGDELIDLVLAHYEQIDSKYKAMMPLKNIYIPTQVDEAQTPGD